MKKHLLVLGLLALMLAYSVSMWGQAATAASSLAGTVTDQTGAVVVGANVTATLVSTGASRTATTGDTGNFRFDGLEPGIYSVKASKTGFATASANAVELLISRNTTQNFSLKTGSTSETVEVTAEAPVLDVEKTSVGLEVTPAMVEDLPLNGRDFSNLAYLAPGARPTAPWDPTKARIAGIGVNGSNGRNMNVTVNGIDNKDNTVGGPVMQLPLEAVQEANISTQRFSAANGRSEGAAMNVITRSGTNSYHGSIYIFDTETALNANDYFSIQNKQPTPDFSRQQFGGRIGGPVVKDKDFLFFAWERLREHTAIPVTAKAFSELSLVNNLNLGTVTFAPQPANTIPTPYFDTRYNGRWDHNITSNHRFFLSYSAQSNNELNDQSGQTNDLTEGNFQTNQLIVANATLNSVLTPRLVNAFTAGFQYWNNLIDSTTRAPLVTFPGSISFGTNTNVPQQSYQRKYQFRDDMSYQAGNHGLKWGVDYLWEPSLGGYFEFNSTLELDFSDYPSVILGNTNGKYPQGFKTPGAVTGMSISNGNPKEDLPGGAKMFGVYFQDTWKASRKLTLDLGMRYDRDFNLMATNAQAGSRTYQLLKAINSPYAGIPKDYQKGFSPRVGFTYDFTGNGNNVLRGGYGLYIAQTFLNIPLFMIQQANPTLFATVFSISGSGPGTTCSSCTVPGTAIPLSAYRLGTDPLPTIPAPITNLTGGAVGRLMSPDYRNPYSQQWNIGFAHQFDANTVAEVEYVHELGLHEEKRQILNYVDPTTGTRTLASALTAAGQPQIARISMETPWGRSRYDGMNLSLRRRMARHFTLNTTYTWSKGWAYGGNAASYSNTVTDPRFPLLASDFGPVPNDERNRWTASGVVDLPWGFSIAPIMQVASARPYTATAGVSNVLGFGTGPAGAHALIQPGSSDPVGFETASNFSAATLKACYLAGTCVQAPFDSLRGQTFFQLDTRVTKTIKIKERANLKLMFQGFDITNRANFGNQFDGNVKNSLAANGATYRTPLNYITANGTIVPKSFRAEFGAQFTF